MLAVKVRIARKLVMMIGGSGDECEDYSHNGNDDDSEGG